MAEKSQNGRFISIFRILHLYGIIICLPCGRDTFNTFIFPDQFVMHVTNNQFSESSIMTEKNCRFITQITAC